MGLCVILFMLGPLEARVNFLLLRQHALNLCFLSQFSFTREHFIAFFRRSNKYWINYTLSGQQKLHVFSMSCCENNKNLHFFSIRHDLYFIFAARYVLYIVCFPNMQQIWVNERFEIRIWTLKQLLFICESEIFEEMHVWDR